MPPEALGSLVPTVGEENHRGQEAALTYDNYGYEGEGEEDLQPTYQGDDGYSYDYEEEDKEDYEEEDEEYEEALALQPNFTHSGEVLWLDKGQTGRLGCGVDR